MTEEQDIQDCPVNYAVWVEYTEYLQENYYEVLPDIVENPGYPDGIFGVTIRWWECYEYEMLDVEQHFGSWLTHHKGMDFAFPYRIPKAWYHALFSVRRVKLQKMLDELNETQERFVSDDKLTRHDVVEY